VEHNARRKRYEELGLSHCTESAGACGQSVPTIGGTLVFPRRIPFEQLVAVDTGENNPSADDLIDLMKRRSRYLELGDLISSARRYRRGSIVAFLNWI
jgi:hypothetical protein